MEQALLQACRDKGDKTENRHKVKEAETMLNSTDSESEEQQRDRHKQVCHHSQRFKQAIRLKQECVRCNTPVYTYVYGGRLDAYKQIHSFT